MLENNPISLLQNFILLTAIQIFTFKLNLDYFTSEYYKQKLTKKIKEIDECSIVDKYNLKQLNKFRDMSIDELKVEIHKLYELVENNEIDVNNRISLLFKGMNMEFVLEDKNVLVKKRKL